MNATTPKQRRIKAWLSSALAILFAAAMLSCSKAPGKEDRFTTLMNRGKNYLDQGQATNALPLFEEAVALNPARPDAHLNLANTCLLLGLGERALHHAQEALSYDRNSAAAYYVAGCANLRLRKFEEALQAFQSSHDLDPTVSALCYQLGRAHQELGHWDEAIAAYREAIKLEPEHPVAHYSLGQALIRVGRQEEALKEIEINTRLRAQKPAPPATPDTYERCKHTRGQAPLQVEMPDPGGVSVIFRDVTSNALGPQSSNYRGPLAVLDYNKDDRNSLFVREGTNGFRLLSNTNGVFTPLGNLLPLRPEATYKRSLVGDMNSDRFEDVLVLGDKASHLFRFATNGGIREMTAASGLKSLVATAGGLVDLDFRGQLDLVAVNPDGGGVRLLRNLGNLYFKDITSTSGIPFTVSGISQVVIDDWNNDDLLDVILARTGQPPLLLLKERGGILVPTNLPPRQIEGTVLAIGDVSNDSRTDLLAGDSSHIDILFGGINKAVRIPLNLPELASLILVDYDNDGWLDILAAGRGLRMLRNLGAGKFEDRTSKLGLENAVQDLVESVAPADFDQDGDTDLAVGLASRGLVILRNDGGNANKQLKVRLVGNRSNATGLGIRLEVAAGAFRVHRTVSALPIEIGLGKHAQVDSLTARWFDLAYNIVDIKPEANASLVVPEPVFPSGSCPYLYAWDGQRFRFVTDILGSAPLGLRIADSVFTDAEPHEYIWIGDDSMFPPRDGLYEVRMTEELREVLYLDYTRLVVVDHPTDTEVHTTDKLVPAKPYPRSELWTLGNPRPPKRAWSLNGSDVTDLILLADRKMLSPEKVRIPQYRGLAEPHGVVLDYGPLPVERPLVLVLTGWLRFGGGMANVASSHNPELPFPFPKLEVETGDGDWQPVNVTAGAPSGKTKTILVDLAGRLPPGSRKLKVTTAFEIHWDRIALLERMLSDTTRVVNIAPTRTNLRWRGFSQFDDLPWTQPLTPVYDKVFLAPHWSITPMGWCTRYGPVDELIAEEDNAFVILNGGDELALSFDAGLLSPRAPGVKRDFFLFSAGWDKDSDFHVELGWKVEPLPWHGMDDQLYGRQKRPAFPADGLMRKFNTRWVGQHTLDRQTR